MIKINIIKDFAIKSWKVLLVIFAILGYLFIGDYLERKAPLSCSQETYYRSFD